MDAISFVLGIKSSHLRSASLRDLVYRGRVLRTSKINADGTATEQLPDSQTNGSNGHQHGDNTVEVDHAQRGNQRHDPQNAWVMAVYLDEDDKEHRWKRSITSSGQSEYRINDRVVGAKDYNLALEEENILIKARNFLVFQGDVEAIAAQSPKDLTRLIEQISGSLEFKADYDRLKDQAETTLEEQNFKLNQRRGMNAEIRQYQEQKKEAENFQKKVQERDGAIVTHVLWKLFHFQHDMEKAREHIRLSQEELKDSRRNIEHYDRRLEEAKKEQAKVARKVSKVETDLKRKEKEIKEKEYALVPVEETIALSRESMSKCEMRIAERSKEHDSQMRNVEKLKRDLETVRKAQSRWETEFQQMTRQQGRELSATDIREYNQLKGQVIKQTAIDQAQSNELTRQLRTDEETVKSLRSSLENFQTQLERAQQEVRDLEERRKHVDGQAKQTSRDLNAKTKELNALASERLRTSQMHTELDEKLRDVLGKLVEAEGGRRENEKEHRARETVKAMKRIFPGIRGRVHQLCKPKQKKYEVAVSTVLGRHFDSIVVDSEKTAKDCIQYLREQRAGQATFVPLDTIQHKAPIASLKGMHRGMRLALDTIDYDREVERAMSYACGNSVVCDDLDVAKYICYQKGVEAKAVTLDGTVIHRGGLMTGGRGPHDRSARQWEDAEVENLRRLKDKIQADLNDLPRGSQRGSEEEKLQSEIAGLEQRLKILDEELHSFDRNIRDKKRERDFAEEKLIEIRPKYQEQAQALEVLKEALQQHQNSISAVEDDVFSSFTSRLGYENIRAYEAQQGIMQHEAAQKRLDFKAQISKLNNQLAFEGQRLQDTKDRLGRLQDQIERDKARVQGLEAEKEDAKSQLDSGRADLERLREQLDEHQQGYEACSGKVAEERREVRKYAKLTDDILRKVNGYEAETARIGAARFALLRKCKIDELNLPLKEGSAKLASLPLDDAARPQRGDTMDMDEGASGGPQYIEDYGIELDFDQLEEGLRNDSSDKQEGELQEIINNLTAELERMAPNMRANDRLESVLMRLKSLEKEFDAAKRAARRAKDEFEDVRTQRSESFKRAFNHISERIAPVYKDLTRTANFPLGGQAYLDIEDAEEPYLSGVKYHAMPPLKRFRDMEHLSGGEKTMAALALLFAIHSYQPSPFFVLDEVDAALDNANVARVAQYVKEHAGPGMQFVVISLKTGFFQNSQTLVGVMRDQSANSSRTLTLDLRKYRDAAPLVAA